MKLCAAPSCTRPAVEGLDRCASCAGKPGGVAVLICTRGRRRRPVVPAKASPQLDLFPPTKKGGPK